MRHNDTGTYSVPSRATYPHQWNWDSALAALGWAELDPARAWTELETLAGARDLQGMIPHIAFHTRVPDRVGPRLRGLLTMVARPYARYLPGPPGIDDLREGLRPLLELPVELVLVSHGEPVLRDGAAAIRAALER